MGTRQIPIIILLFFFMALSNVYAVPSPVIMYVTNCEGAVGDVLTVAVTVNDASQIAASAFTITYDQTALEIQANIETPFFQTFANQWATITPQPDPMPENSVVVNGATYTKAVVINHTPGKVMISGANCDTGIGNGNTLAVVQFKILDFTISASDNAPYKDYKITVKKSRIDNTSAGQPGTNEDTPFFISYDKTQTDPQFQYPEIPIMNVSPIQGSIRVRFDSPEIDSDNDGISDAWELENFGALDHDKNYYENINSDNDNFSDYQEYVNGTSPNSNDPDACLILMNNVSYKLMSNSITQIYGCSGANNICLESGAVARLFYFVDNNTVTLDSASSQFTVFRSGSTVTIEGSDGTKLIIPATTMSQTIIFADGASDLIIQGDAVFLGTQEIVSSPTPVSVPVMSKPQIVQTFSKGLEKPDAHLILTNNFLYSLPSESSTIVYGSAGVNTIILENRAAANLVSFSDNNIITIGADSGLFTVFRSGTIVTLEGSDGTELTIPATDFGQTIIFEDAILELKIKFGSVYIGDQVIDENPHGLKMVR